MSLTKRSEMSNKKRYMVGAPNNPLPNDLGFNSLKEAEAAALEIQNQRNQPVAVWDMNDNANTLYLAWEGHLFK